MPHESSSPTTDNLHLCRSSTRWSTLNCYGWPMQRADATLWTWTTLLCSPPCFKNTGTPWRWVRETQTRTTSASPRLTSSLCYLCAELMFCTPWWQDLAEELQGRQKRVSSLQEIVSELLPEADGEDSAEAREKLHVIGSKLRLLSRQVNQDLQTIEERLVKHCSSIYST